MTKPGHRYFISADYANTSNVPLNTAITVGSGVDLIIDDGSLHNYAGITISSGGSLRIETNGQIFNRALITNNGTVPIKGEFIQAPMGVYAGASPTYSGLRAELHYSGSSTSVTTGAEFPPILNAALLIYKSGQATTLNGNKIVNGDVLFFNGKLVLGNNSLTLNGSITFFDSASVAGGAGASLIVSGSGAIGGKCLIGTPAQFGGGLTMNRAGAALTLDGMGLSSTPLSVLAGSLYTGTVNHSFSSPITIGASAELDVNAGSTTTFGGNSVNNGALTLNGTLNMGTTIMSGTGGLAINPTGTLVTAHPTGLVGALTNSGFITHSGTVQIQGASVGNILGLNLNNLVIDRATPVTLPQNLSVNGNLSIINAGNFDLAGRTLTLGAGSSTSTTATGRIDASGTTSVLALYGSSVNGAHFTGGFVRNMEVIGTPTLANSLAITGTLNLLNNLTLGAPNGRLWLRNSAMLNAPGTKIQGTNPTSEVIIESGFNEGVMPGSAFAMPYHGTINLTGAQIFSGNFTMSATAGTLTLNGAMTLGASSILTLNQTAANSLTGAATIQGSGASSGIVFGTGFNGGVVPADRFASPLNANVTTPGGTSSLANGSIILGAAQTLTLGGKLTTTPANLLRVSNSSPAAILGAALARYIDGPLERQLLPGIGSDGTSYQFPIGDATSYRPLNLVNVRTGAAPLVRATVYPSGATTPDNTTLQTLLSGRNWRLETLAGSLISTTLELLEGGLPPTSLVGTATAQSGVYSSIGGSPMTGGVRSNPQAALSDRYFSIAGVPPNVYYYNETLLGDASLPTSWNSAPNGSGVSATAALMTGGSTTAFIVRSGITARANTGLTFGTASTLTIQGSGTLIIQSGTFTNGANTSILGTLHTGDGALWNNLATASVGTSGVLRFEGAASLSGNLPVFTATSSALEYTGTTPKTV